MDGYKLSRNWFDWCFENPEKISPNHSAIYFFAIEHCNRLGWKEKFGFPTQMAMDALGIRKHETYIRYFNDIVEWGFFILIQKSTNQYSANIISLSTAIPKNGKALDKAFLKHRGKQTQPIGESNRSIDKQVTSKPETNIAGDFFEEELKRVTDNALSNSLREWWKYKKGKYDAIGWKKTITIVLKYPANNVCDRIDEAIASSWQGMNLSTMKVGGKQIETNTQKIMVSRSESDIYN